MRTKRSGRKSHDSNSLINYKDYYIKFENNRSYTLYKSTEGLTKLGRPLGYYRQLLAVIEDICHAEINSKDGLYELEQFINSYKNISENTIQAIRASKK